MNGEFIRIETLEEIATLKREVKRLKELKLSNDKNVLDANIKLQDENNMLKRDIKILENRIDEAIKYINSVPNNNADGFQYGRESLAEEILAILKGE